MKGILYIGIILYYIDRERLCPYKVIGCLLK